MLFAAGALTDRVTFPVLLHTLKKQKQKKKPSSMGFGDLAEVFILAGKALVMNCLSEP